MIRREMELIKNIQKGIQTLVYTGLVFLVNNFFVYKIFPRIVTIPTFVGYFLTAVTGIVWVLGCIVALTGEN